VSEDEVGSSVETGLVARDYLCVSGWPSVLDEHHTDIDLLRHESMLTKRSYSTFYSNNSKNPKL